MNDDIDAELPPSASLGRYPLSKADAARLQAVDFIKRWGKGGTQAALNERQGAQQYFLDLCHLLDVPEPGASADYVFEKQTLALGQQRGFADVFKRDHFAWENKAPGKNLDDALKQLLGYSLALDNPPILVVSDRLTLRIHTQFNGHPSERFEVSVGSLTDVEQRDLLRRLWTDPASFRPKITSREITEQAARSFATLAEGLRKRDQAPDAVAHFLTQCLFCFFAEDVGLLPGRMFERLLKNRHITSAQLTVSMKGLFETMRDGGMYGSDCIPWFNGGLFKAIDVPTLSIMEVTELRNAAALNWSAIDVSIFGTLFERGLDPAKRSQLGAHYTDPATIERLIEPVMRRPLRQEWALTKGEIDAALKPSKKFDDRHHKAAKAIFVSWLERLRAYRVLDPACGSGNFLFLGLKALKDIEHLSRVDMAQIFGRETDLVTGPHNMLGIELNEYAAELARLTVWIGELQWRMARGYEFKVNPVLEPLDQIACQDALIRWENEVAVEAEWPKASVVIGNPPFLGGSKKRGELGDAYFEALKAVFSPLVPGFGDLVCYWFAKALKAIESNGLGAAGLVSTNSIRGGANRKVLEAIVERSRIFEAWSDEAWVNDGAAVRVSLVCFGHASNAVLDGAEVVAIHADLTPSGVDGVDLDLTNARQLAESQRACFMGASKKAPFDVSGEQARQWLGMPNPNGKSNAFVVRPLCNGIDVTRRWGDRWIVDFGTDMPESDAMLFEAPYQYVLATVKPLRALNNREAYRLNWWRHAEARPGMRLALTGVRRFIVTAAVAKHRSFIWMHGRVLPDQATLAIARADDTTFGILHSRFHELWSLRMCTWLGVGNDPRYTPTTCFETFPFPQGLTPADTADQQIEALEGGASIPAGILMSNVPLVFESIGFVATKKEVIVTLRDAAIAIAVAAKRLDDLRQNWLNPPEWTTRLPEVVPLGMNVSPYPDRIVPKFGISEADAKALQKRTLTNLYNARPAWLSAAHATLDLAVASAYGWADYSAEMHDNTILARLLALNIERAKTRP